MWGGGDINGCVEVIFCPLCIYVIFSFEISFLVVDQS